MKQEVQLDRLKEAGAAAWRLLGLEALLDSEGSRGVVIRQKRKPGMYVNMMKYQ